MLALALRWFTNEVFIFLFYLIFIIFCLMCKDTCPNPNIPAVWPSFILLPALPVMSLGLWQSTFPDLLQYEICIQMWHTKGVKSKLTEFRIKSPNALWFTYPILCNRPFDLQSVYKHMINITHLNMDFQKPFIFILITFTPFNLYNYTN